MSKKKTNEEFLAEVYSKRNDIIIIGEYAGAREKILIKCSDCKYEWETQAGALVRENKTGCLLCSNNKKASSFKKSNEEFVKEVYDLVGSEYEFKENYQGSNIKIKVKHNCINCENNEYMVLPTNFLKGKRCPKCSTIRGAKLIRKSHEDFIREVHDLTGDEYEVLNEYVNSKIKVQLKHNCIDCNNYNWYVSPQSFLRGNRCPKCGERRRNEFNKKRKKTQEQFEKEVFNLVGDEYDTKSKYTGSENKILLRHEICGYEYMVKPNNFLQGQRCPKCVDNHEKTLDIRAKNFIKGYDVISNGEYEIIGEYINSKTKIKVKHNKCNTEFLSSPSNLLRGKGCPNCKSSKGEKEINKILDSIRLEYVPQYKFSDCKNIKSLPFDFAVINNAKEVKMLIEFDGEQHFRAIKHFGDKEKFKKQKINDQIKNDYCFNNNIPLLRIPYWESENIEHILFDFLVEHGAIEEINV